MQKPVEACMTCYGTGETTEGGGPLETCPDCFGAGKTLSRGTKLEWRLRAIENSHRTVPQEASPDVLWLASELRRAREALLRIMARCQDADESDVAAREVKYFANEALEVYERC